MSVQINPAYCRKCKSVYAGRRVLCTACMGDWNRGFEWLLERSTQATQQYVDLVDSLDAAELARWDNVQLAHMAVEGTPLTSIRIERERFERRLDETIKFGGMIAAVIQYWRNHLATCRDVDDYIQLGLTLGTPEILARIKKYNHQ